MNFDIVIALEKKLLDPVVRTSSILLENLLADEFVEFGTSGEIYDKKNIIACLPVETPVSIEAFDFIPIQLAPDIIQLRFKTRRKTEDGSSVTALRSSIWKKAGENWQMVFHQGTATEE